MLEVQEDEEDDNRLARCWRWRKSIVAGTVLKAEEEKVTCRCGGIRGCCLASSSSGEAALLSTTSSSSSHPLPPLDVRCVSSTCAPRT